MRRVLLCRLEDVGWALFARGIGGVEAPVVKHRMLSCILKSVEGGFVCWRRWRCWRCWKRWRCCKCRGGVLCATRVPEAVNWMMKPINEIFIMPACTIEYCADLNDASGKLCCESSTSSGSASGGNRNGLTTIV